MSRLWPTGTLDYSAVARLMRRRDLASAPWVHGPAVRGSRGAQELSATPRSKSSKSAKIEKIATLADQHVRCFSGTAVSEAAGLGSSTVGARPGGLLVAESAGGERGALLKVGIFQVCKRVEWSAWATTTSYSRLKIDRGRLPPPILLNLSS